MTNIFLIAEEYCKFIKYCDNVRIASNSIKLNNIINQNSQNEIIDKLIWYLENHISKKFITNKNLVKCCLNDRNNFILNNNHFMFENEQSCEFIYVIIF